jgi:hypothetical protein
MTTRLGGTESGKIESLQLRKQRSECPTFTQGMGNVCSIHEYVERQSGTRGLNVKDTAFALVCIHHQMFPHTRSPTRLETDRLEGAVCWLCENWPELAELSSAGQVQAAKKVLEYLRSRRVTSGEGSAATQEREPDGKVAAQGGDIEQGDEGAIGGR